MILPLCPLLMAAQPEHKTVNERYQRGAEYFRLGRLDDAIAAFEEAVRRTTVAQSV